MAVSLYELIFIVAFHKHKLTEGKFQIFESLFLSCIILNLTISLCFLEFLKSIKHLYWLL